MEQSKEEKYISINKQIKSLVTSSDHFISNLSNITSLIHEHFNFHWVGFYLVSEENKELYLGPFQGPIACTKIKYGMGVCGSAWKQNKVLIVDDVHKFKGHIACSSQTNSEIVLPLVLNDEVIAVLDIDSINFNSFDQIDEKYLKEALEHLISCTNKDLYKTI